MIALFVSLILLGLAAVDPVGIAAMPILLSQKNPFRRSFVFLGGSFCSLMTMGLLFAQGFGAMVLRFENSHARLIPNVEVAAGIILLCIAGVIFWRTKTGKLSTEPSKDMTKRLRLGDWQLFILGALLVAFQSAIDVVFVIAMIHIGQLHLSTLTLTAAVATYATAALLIQFAVVVTYKLTPLAQRVKTLNKVHILLANYANQTLIGTSLLLGCILLVAAT